MSDQMEVEDIQMQDNNTKILNKGTKMEIENMKNEDQQIKYKKGVPKPNINQIEYNKPFQYEEFLKLTREYYEYISKLESLIIWIGESSQESKSININITINLTELKKKGLFIPQQRFDLTKKLIVPKDSAGTIYKIFQQINKESPIPTLLTGPQGAGKSHFLLAFSIALQADESCRIFYINEPQKLTSELALQEFVRMAYRDLVNEDCQINISDGKNNQLSLLEVVKSLQQNLKNIQFSELINRYIADYSQQLRYQNKYVIFIGDQINQISNLKNRNQTKQIELYQKIYEAFYPYIIEAQSETDNYNKLNPQQQYEIRIQKFLNDDEKNQAIENMLQLIFNEGDERQNIIKTYAEDNLELVRYFIDKIENISLLEEKKLIFQLNEEFKQLKRHIYKINDDWMKNQINRVQCEEAMGSVALVLDQEIPCDILFDSCLDLRFVYTVDQTNQWKSIHAAARQVIRYKYLNQSITIKWLIENFTNYDLNSSWGTNFNFYFVDLILKTLPKQACKLIKFEVNFNNLGENIYEQLIDPVTKVKNIDKYNEILKIKDKNQKQKELKDLGKIYQVNPGKFDTEFLKFDIIKSFEIIIWKDQISLIPEKQQNIKTTLNSLNSEANQAIAMCPQGQAFPTIDFAILTREQFYGFQIKTGNDIIAIKSDFRTKQMSQLYTFYNNLNKEFHNLIGKKVQFNHIYIMLDKKIQLNVSQNVGEKFLVDFISHMESPEALIKLVELGGSQTPTLQKIGFVNYQSFAQLNSDKFEKF